MIGLRNIRNKEIINQWYVLLPGFKTSTTEFYQAVENGVEERQVPGIGMATVELPEGGILSPRRLYLRMFKERMFFDVCCGSFGESWFFSCRFAEKGLRLPLWMRLVLFGILCGIVYCYTLVFGLLLGIAIAFLSIFAALFLLNNLATSGTDDLDSVLLKIPIVGSIYETYFRRETYYREDSRLLFSDLVNQIVRTQVEEFTGKEDVTKVEFKEVPVPKSGGIFGWIGDSLRRLWGG